jgi:nicotinamide-nucleotide amidase
MTPYRSAAVVTVGTELVRGLAIDTNTAEIAQVLFGAGIDVGETVSLPDDEGALTEALRRCSASYDLVVVTGGLGPTHDDVTRQAAAGALGLSLTRNDSLVETLRASVAWHTDDRSAEQVYRQADVIDGATVLPAVRGTAPGQVAPTSRGAMVLLPGPPHEMRPLLHALADGWRADAAGPRVLRFAGLFESDLQLAAQDVLAGRTDIELTLLAKPGDVRIVLFDRGAGAQELDEAASAIAASVGDACYSTDGSSLAEVVLARASAKGLTLATAESCTGGLVAGALTDVPCSSAAYLGGVVSYADEAKVTLLGVDPGLIAACGAVSDAVAQSMAAGACHVFGADAAVSVTGIAGPDGGSPGKPVGTVWFAVAGPDGVEAQLRRFAGDRAIVRERAVMAALDLLRRALPRS